jgi:hypothetical protein
MKSAVKAFFVVLWVMSLSCAYEEEVSIDGRKILIIGNKKCASARLTQNIDTIIVERERMSFDSTANSVCYITPDGDYVVSVSGDIVSDILDKGYKSCDEDIYRCMDAYSESISE